MGTLNVNFIQDKGVVDLALTNESKSFTTPQRAAQATVVSGSFDLNSAQNFIYTPSGDQTLSFTNETAGQTGIIFLTNSGHTITLGAEIMAPDGMATSISSAGEYFISYAVEASGGGAGTVKISFVTVV